MSAHLAATTYEVKLTPQERPTAQPHERSETSRNDGAHKYGDESDATPTLVLEVERPVNQVSPSNNSESKPSCTPARVPAGTVAHVVLLSRLRAPKSRAGDAFLARLAEPIRLDSRVVLPEGVVLEGRVVRSVPPRWLNRPGSLSLTFTQLRLPVGGAAAIVASPSAAVVDWASGLQMGSEGEFVAARPSKARFLIDLGVAGGISKAADDSFQLVAETLISTATSASTAGSAKILAAALSGLYLLTRHGRDVSLPPYTRMGISFERPALLSSRPLATPAGR